VTFDTAMIHAIVPTPEGVPLRFAVASVPERALAFGIDALVLVLAMALLEFAGLWLFPSSWLLAIANLALFLLRVGYFAWFETRWNGTTIGKRMLKLRVIRADGGPLTPEVLLARNLTREVEFFLPLAFLFAPDTLWSGHGVLLRLLAGVWILLLLLFPLTNRLRLRVGDLLAGTLVVLSPKASLLRDMASAEAPKLEAADAAITTAPALAFTASQLSVYGIFELQVLEDVLRKARTAGGAEAVLAVATKIQARIGWDQDGEPVASLPFLQAFYAAQRAHLEHKLLLGKRKERKDPPSRQPRRR
jgi:uncharacterized RDD family membrane protein YckC